MVQKIKKNWHEIKKMMQISQTTDLCWVDYSQRINNGLSNNILTKNGCGGIILFVERLPEYAKLSNEYLKYASKLDDSQILFINENRDFLLSIK